ncbi:MAG TPA: hypothetical protein PLF88_11860 [Opitutaceae bacterium]|nr:hypothetical protein [Opitutaceae bacterium]
MKATAFLFAALLTGSALGARSHEADKAAAPAELVHVDVVIVDVRSEGQLLVIMEHVGKMEGVHDVKRKAFDRKTKEGRIEIIGEPRIRQTYRAYLEAMPKTKVSLKAKPDGKDQKNLPDWFKPSAP